MTWMIHDVSPWRIDAVHIAPDGAAWVSTTFVHNSEEVGVEGTRAAWRRVTDGDKLAALLDRLFSASPAGALSQPVADETLPVAPAGTAGPTREWFSLAGWRWVVPGVLGGLVIGLLASRRRAPAEPRRVLLDQKPEPVRT
jgi:hypothetical protein